MNVIKELGKRKCRVHVPDDMTSFGLKSILCTILKQKESIKVASRQPKTVDLLHLFTFSITLNPSLLLLSNFMH